MSVEQPTIEKISPQEAKEALRKILVEKYLNEECKLKNQDENCGLKFVDDNIKTPQVINPKKLSSVDMPEELAHKLINTVVNYLHKPRIIDNFSNHKQRRAWRCTLDENLQEEFKNNKLRINSITPVYSTLELFDEKVTDSNLKNKITELIKQFPKEIIPKDISFEENNQIRAGLIPPAEENNLEIKSYDTLESAEKNKIIDRVNQICIEFLNLLK